MIDRYCSKCSYSDVVDEEKIGPSIFGYVLPVAILFAAIVGGPWGIIIAVVLSCIFYIMFMEDDGKVIEDMRVYSIVMHGKCPGCGQSGCLRPFAASIERSDSGNSDSKAKSNQANQSRRSNTHKPKDNIADGGRSAGLDAFLNLKGSEFSQKAVVDQRSPMGEASPESDRVDITVEYGLLIDREMSGDQRCGSLWFDCFKYSGHRSDIQRKLYAAVRRQDFLHALGGSAGIAKSYPSRGAIRRAFLDSRQGSVPVEKIISAAGEVGFLPDKKSSSTVASVGDKGLIEKPVGVVFKYDFEYSQSTGALSHISSNTTFKPAQLKRTETPIPGWEIIGSPKACWAADIYTRKVI